MRLRQGQPPNDANEFQSTHLLRDASYSFWDFPMICIFQSTHLLRDASCFKIKHNIAASFQSTHLLRDASRLSAYFCISGIFQSTHLLRDASGINIDKQIEQLISIHASLARCVFSKQIRLAARFNFNPRISCEMRQRRPFQILVAVSFQSTHLLRDASFGGNVPRCAWARHFNPRISCEMRQMVLAGVTNNSAISIHASLARCVRLGHKMYRCNNYFNPRISCEMRLELVRRLFNLSRFQSTHLLRDASLFR